MTKTQGKQGYKIQLGTDYVYIDDKPYSRELIASAPELLEACKEALTAFQLLGSGQKPSLSNAELCEIVGQAIAKAEGRI